MLRAPGVRLVAAADGARDDLRGRKAEAADEGQRRGIQEFYRELWGRKDDLRKNSLGWEIKVEGVELRNRNSRKNSTCDYMLFRKSAVITGWILWHIDL